MSLIPIPDLETVNAVKGGTLQFFTIEDMPNTIVIDYVDGPTNILNDFYIDVIQRSIKMVLSTFTKPTIIRKLKIIINTQTDMNIFISNEMTDHELVSLFIPRIKTLNSYAFN